MATLQELLDLESVVVAGEFDFDGSILDYEAKMDMSEELAQMIAEFCAAVSGFLTHGSERHELGTSTRLVLLWRGVVGMHRRRWKAGSVRGDVQG